MDVDLDGRHREGGLVRRQDFPRDDQRVRLAEFHGFDDLKIRKDRAGEILHAAVFVNDIQIVLVPLRRPGEVSADDPAQRVFDRLRPVIEGSRL